MRNNTMTKCAVGAMLFGGTLGGATAANAGVVGVAGNSSSAILSLAYYSDPYLAVGNFGSPMNGPVSAVDPTVGSITCSQFLPSGFSLTINSTAAANQQSFVVQQNFTVTGAVNFTLTGEKPVSSSAVSIESGGIFYADSGSNAGVFTISGTLQTGTYRFVYSSAAIGPQSGTLFNLSFSAVPAPGAVALLGVAGLVGARRRRA